MHRRHFLLALTALFISPSAFAEKILHGSSAEDGQRDRQAWLNVTTKLKGLRLAKPNDQIQFVVFFDPNCPACADFWQWFNQQTPRELASLWIPVAYMNQLSTAKSVALLRTTDPYAAMAQNYKDFNRQLRQ
jgi:protein-disulfide isomerase